jgi:hypothetical protein
MLAEANGPVRPDGGPGHFVYASGLTLEEINAWVHAATRELIAVARGRPIVVFWDDASSWDGHNSEDLAGRGAGRRVEDQWIASYWEEYRGRLHFLTPRDERNFWTAIRFMARNVGKTKDGSIRYKLPDGGRKSGDGCTSCGNTADNMCIHRVGMELYHIPEEETFGIYLGDDCLTFTFEEHAIKLKAYYSTNPFGLNYKDGEGCGYELLFHGATYEASFCSMLLMPAVIGGEDTFVFGLDPRRLFSKTFWRTSDDGVDLTLDEKVYYCRTVARGLLGAVQHVDGVYDVIKALSDIPTTQISKTKARRINQRIADANEYSISRGSAPTEQRAPAQNHDYVLAIFPELRLLEGNVDKMVAAIKRTGYVDIAELD